MHIECLFYLRLSDNHILPALPTYLTHLSFDVPSHTTQSQGSLDATATLSSRY